MTAVLVILEAIFMYIRKILPHLNTACLQSDKASPYQNSSILFMIPRLSYVHGICIRRFFHTETQDGKSVLKAHFARAFQAVLTYCKEGTIFIFLR